MKKIDKIEKLFEEHNSIMSTAQLVKNKIYYADIQRYLKRGIIEKVKRGYYHWVNTHNRSEVGVIVGIFPSAIICMYSALYYYGYIDNVPLEWHLAFSNTTSRRIVCIEYPKVQPYHIKPELLQIGLDTGIINYMPVRIYDRERVICDCLRYVNKMDREVFKAAVLKYVNDPKKNVPNLMKYAEIFKVTQKVKNIIGVWI